MSSFPILIFHFENRLSVRIHSGYTWVPLIAAPPEFKNTNVFQNFPWSSHTGQPKYSVTQPLTHVVKPTLHCLPSLQVSQPSLQEQRWLQFPLSGVVGLSVDVGGVGFFVSRVCLSRVCLSRVGYGTVEISTLISNMISTLWSIIYPSLV